MIILSGRYVKSNPDSPRILGMLKLGVATGYDIKRVIDGSTRFFWTASYGQIYPELKRLRKAGLVRAEQAPRGKVKRTVYELTPKGEEALHEWLTDNQEVLFEIRDESLLRLFFGDLLSRDEVIANLRTQQQIFELILQRFREIEVDAKQGVEEGRVYPVCRASVRDRLHHFRARLVCRDGAPPRGRRGASSSRTTRPPAGKRGSGPPVSAAAIWPQSGWWPTTTTWSPRPSTAARTSSALAPGASRSSGSDSTSSASRARRRSRAPAAAGS